MIPVGTLLPAGEPREPGPVWIHPQLRDLLAWAFGGGGQPFVARGDAK